MRNDELLKQMGAKIKQQRKFNRMTLQQVAELSGINMSNMWFIEQGKRNVHILSLKSIADVFKIDIKELL